jgi:hypothetical protein
MNQKGCCALDRSGRASEAASNDDLVRMARTRSLRESFRSISHELQPLATIKLLEDLGEKIDAPRSTVEQGCGRHRKPL